jgi:hypothetical protein
MSKRMKEFEVRNRFNIGCTEILLAPRITTEGLREILGCCEPEWKDEQTACISKSSRWLTQRGLREMAQAQHVKVD